MFIKYFLFLFVTCGWTYLLPAQSTYLTDFRVAFYNVENLFDTVDNPDKEDEAFTPNGRKGWTMSRYRRKLNQISQVFDMLEYPAVVGLAEIENKNVLADLVETKSLVPAKYAHVSYDSPDMRGIDVGLLYRQDLFTLDSVGYIRIDFPTWLEPEGYTTRDILYARLNGGAYSTFHCLIMHWPSRYGGMEQSEHRRLWAAQHVRQAVDNILRSEPDAKIVIMGDFNDEPSNRSVHNVLGAIAPVDSIALPGVLYNQMYTLDEKGEGSYNYRGSWNMLDQFITHGLGWPANWRVNKASVYKPDWLLYEGTRPNRTYGGGDSYYGGHSDHLPIYLDIKLWEE